MSLVSCVVNRGACLSDHGSLMDMSLTKKKRNVELNVTYTLVMFRFTFELIPLSNNGTSYIFCHKFLISTLEIVYCGIMCITKHIRIPKATVQRRLHETQVGFNQDVLTTLPILLLKLQSF